MKLFALVIISVFSSSLLASIQKIEAAKHYQVASGLCRAYTQDQPLKKVLTTLEVTSKNIYQGAKTVVTQQNFGLSQDTKSLISSSEYHKALTECFGSFSENRVKWDSFTLMLILSDAAGQAVTYYGLYKVSTGAFKLLRLFSNLRNLSKLKVLQSYLVSNPTMFKYLTKAATVLIAAGTLKVFYDAYNGYRSTFDSKYKSEQRNSEIEIAIRTLDDDYKPLLNDIALDIANEKKKPKSGQDKNKISSLTKEYYDTLAEYKTHRAELIKIQN